MDSTWKSKLSEPKLRDILVLGSVSLKCAYAPQLGHASTAPSNNQDFNLCCWPMRQTWQTQKMPGTGRSTLTIPILSKNLGFCCLWQQLEQLGWSASGSWKTKGYFLTENISHAQKACRHFRGEPYHSWREWQDFEKEKKNLVLFWNLHGQWIFFSLTITLISAFLLNNRKS